MWLKYIIVKKKWETNHKWNISLTKKYASLIKSIINSDKISKNIINPNYIQYCTTTIILQFIKKETHMNEAFKKKNKLTAYYNFIN